MKQNRKFALSTIALLIQTAVAMQANAEAREIPVGKTTDYIGLITNDEEQVWTNDSIIVNKYIQPYWEKNKPHRKLGVVTTGKGDNGNLEVNGFYGILSYADRGLEYKPELYIKSNNDITFNNNFQSVYIQPHSNKVSLDAKGKIDFNLNILEKALDDKNQEYLVNDKSLIKYLNYTTDGTKGSLSLTSKLGNHLNLNAKIHKGIHHSGIVNHLNTNVNLTATEGDNVIALNAHLEDKIDNPANFSTPSYLRGIETAFKSHTTLVGENNKVSITTEGNGLGLGLGKQNPSKDSPYSGHTTGIFINNQPNNLDQPTIDGFSSVNLKATKGNNEVDINVRNHSSVKGIIATHNSKATLEAEEGNNIIKVKNPDLNTPIERAEGEHYRTGIQSSTDSQVTLTAKNNIVEVAGNPMYQEGLQVDSNSSITATAKENNEITVENAAYGSDGVSTLIPQANGRPSLTNDGNKIILEAGKDNIITMKATDADMDYLENSAVLKETNHYKGKKGSNGILSAGDKSLVKLTGKNNYILTELSDKARAFEHNGVVSQDGAKVGITAKEDNAIAGANDGSNAHTQATVTIDGKNNTILAFQNGMKAFGKGQQTVTASEKNEIIGGGTGVWTRHEGSHIALNGKENQVSSKLGLYASEKSQQTLKAEDKNEINGSNVAIYSDDSTINLDSQKSNIVNLNVNSKADKTVNIFASNNGSILLTAKEDNTINAKHEGIKSDTKASVTLAARNNTINASETGIYSLNSAKIDVNGQIKLSSKIANHASTEGRINLNYADKSEITGATIANGGNIA
ncbi:TPA: autotransporter outer membrane beta-barrel domain-containing protein, partial [Neisseria subflava]